MTATNSELIIKLPAQSPHAHVTIIEQDGMHRQKDVSVEDLVSHLAQNHQFSTGLLPQGTRVYRGTRNDYTIAVELPAKVRPIRYTRYNDRDRRTTDTAQIPFPVCLFVFSVRSNTIRRTNMFCARNPIQRLEDRLCFFPFGNVYGDGNICWGSAHLPNISTPMELVGVINIFLDSNYNGDLFERSHYRQPSRLEEGEPEPADFWSLVRYLNGKPEFPAEMLRSNDRTFQSAIGRE